MINNEENKSLMVVKEQSFFQRIKNFLKKLFRKEENLFNTASVQNIEEKTIPINSRTSFSEEIRIVEDEETKLLKLQKQYHSGEIKESDMSQEQIDSLCNLYDKQIERLEKSNEIRKQKLLEYRKKLQTDN